MGFGLYAAAISLPSESANDRIKQRRLSTGEDEEV